MQRYWDYSEEERGKMTREQVDAFSQVELMEKGVVNPEPLRSLDDCPKPPELEMERRFKVGDVYFDTHEKAIKFVELSPMKLGYDYNLGYDLKFCEPFEITVESISVYKRENLFDHKSVLMKRKSFVEERKKQENEYNEALKKVNAAVKSIYDDWFECMEHVRLLDKVRQTYSEYKKLSGGDENIALGFLKKVYDNEIIEKAGINTIEFINEKIEEE